MRKQLQAIRKNNPAAMRSRVIDSAAPLFQARGYGATSMHDIIHAASVTGGALYHHFPSKKDLALAVISERVSSEVEETWISAVRKGPNAGEAIVGVFEHTAALLDKKGAVSGCPLGNLAGEFSLAGDELRDAVQSEYEVWRDAIAKRLAQDARFGRATFAAGNFQGFADVIVAMFTGAMSIAKVEQRTTALWSCAKHLRMTMGLSGR